MSKSRTEEKYFLFYCDWVGVLISFLMLRLSQRKLELYTWWNLFFQKINLFLVKLLSALHGKLYSFWIYSCNKQLRIRTSCRGVRGGLLPLNLGTSFEPFAYPQNMTSVLSVFKVLLWKMSHGLTGYWFLFHSREQSTLQSSLC